jgi:arylsulfatase A-like enzyme
MKIFWLPILTALLSFTAAQAEKPNVLFIIVDDLMKQVELYGNETIKTPELNKLAAEAMLFDCAYCQYPLCGPSRAAMMMSKYPNKSGITWNQGGKSDSVQKKARSLGVETLPAFFKQNGYITLGGGKLYHNSVIPDEKSALHDFNIAFSPTGKDGKKVKVGKGVKITTITEASEHGIYEHKDGHLVAEAKKWLTEHGKEKPFFMCIGLKKPHSPFSAPKEFFKRYQRDEIQVSTIKPPAGILEHYSLSSPDALLKVHADTREFTAYTLPVEKKKEIIHGYYACVAYMDFLVGDLLNTLKENGLYENTIILFTSDHGYKLGEYDRWAKYTVHEKDAVVPLLIRVPSLQQGHGTTSASIIGLIDLYPTLAELCGLPQPENIDGISFVSTLKNPETSIRDYIHTFVTRAETENPAAVGASIMHRNGYRYTQWSQEKASDFPTGKPVGIELYDHYDNQNTPISTENIIRKRPELEKTMQTACQQVQ